MKKFKIGVSVLLLPLFLGFLLISCDELVSDSTTCPSVYTMTSVQVLTAEGQPVALDEWIVYDKDTGKELELCDSDDCASASFSGTNKSGTYILIDDRIQEKTDREIKI